MFETIAEEHLSFCVVLASFLWVVQNLECILHSDKGLMSLFSSMKWLLVRMEL